VITPARRLHLFGPAGLVCGMAVEETTTVRTTHDGRALAFCSTHCRDEFLAAPQRS
jgi:YHS domain-containing protein